VQDQATGLHSYLNVYEKILFSRTPTQSDPAPVPLTQMRVFATWAVDAEDVNQEFEFEVNLAVAGSDRIEAINKGQVTCTSSEGFIRIISHLIGPLPIVGPGIMRLQNRMRRIGDKEWITQEYPILYEEIAVSTSAAASPAT
jgi:hypothetical protein